MRQQTFKVYEAREVRRQPYNSLLIDFHKLSRGNEFLSHVSNGQSANLALLAHSQMILVANFYSSLQSNQQISPILKEVLKDLYRLFCLYTIDNESREFAKAGAVSDEQLDGLSQRILQLMGRIRPHAVPLVDAWALPDYLLNRYALKLIVSLTC